MVYDLGGNYHRSGGRSISSYDQPDAAEKLPNLEPQKESIRYTLRLETEKGNPYE